MHFPVGFHNKNDNPFPLDPKNREAHFDELDYMVTYEAMENLIKTGQETDPVLEWIFESILLRKNTVNVHAWCPKSVKAWACRISMSFKCRVF